MQIETFQDYIEFTRTTAVYPKDRELDYLIFGMIDEMGEFIRKSEPIEEGYFEYDTKEAVDELSDICWYVARLFDYFSIDSNEYDTNINYVYPHEESLRGINQTLLHRLLKMAGYNKKFIRDGNEEKYDLMRESMSFILFNLSELATLSGGYNLRNVLQINVDKLSDRKERGVLKGDGDHR